MVKNSSMNAECRLAGIIKLGGREWFIGEIIRISSTKKPPLLYHNGKYWNLGNQIQKPKSKIISEVNSVIEKYKVNEKVLCN